MKRAGLIILAFGFLFFAQLAQAQWTTAKRLTWSPDYSGTPAIAIDPSGTIHVAYEDMTPGNAELYYKKSTDGGATWSPSQRLTWTLGDSVWATMAADSSGGIHVAWEDFTPEHNAIYFKNSTDGGVTWSSSRGLTWTSGNSYNSALAVDSSDNLHLAWNDDTPGNLEIYYMKSTDRGATWSARQRLTWDSRESGWPAIVADSSGNPHVFWTDGEVCYRKSTDGGDTWLAFKRLSYTAGNSGYSAVAVDNSDNLHVAWNDYTPGNWEIYYMGSSDEGVTWTTSKRITWTSLTSQYPGIDADSAGHLHVVWWDGTPGNHEIYYKKSTDGGATWAPNQRLTWNTGKSDGPALAADSLDNLHVVWMDDTPGNWEIYYRKYVKE